MVYKILKSTKPEFLEKTIQSFIEENPDLKVKIKGGISILPESKYRGTLYFQTITVKEKKKKPKENEEI